jgi:hypothetical protein
VADQRKSAKSGYHKFKSEDGMEFGSFEIFWDDADVPPHGGPARNYDSAGEPVTPGWYWWACFPGCLPDGEASGPFDTSTEAYDSAQEI